MLPAQAHLTYHTTEIAHADAIFLVQKFYSFRIVYGSGKFELSKRARKFRASSILLIYRMKRIICKCGLGYDNVHRLTNETSKLELKTRSESEKKRT